MGAINYRISNAEKNELNLNFTLRIDEIEFEDYEVWLNDEIYTFENQLTLFVDSLQSKYEEILYNLDCDMFCELEVKKEYGYYEGVQFFIEHDLYSDEIDVSAYLLEIEKTLLDWYQKNKKDYPLFSILTNCGWCGNSFID